MDYYTDTTSLAYPIVNWANYAPFEPPKREQKNHAAQTEFADNKSGVVDFFKPKTGPLAPTQTVYASAETIAKINAPTTVSDAAKVVTASVSLAAKDEVERITKQRVQLMAANYAGGAQSAEIVARLEILNHRLLERSPRITEAHVSSLEKAHEVLSSIQESREQRARRRASAT